MLPFEQENKNRWTELTAAYDPFTGEGSKIERFPLRISVNAVVNLPANVGLEDNYLVSLIRQHGGIDDLADYLDSMNGLEKFSREAIYAQFDALRCGQDFEFWTYSCVKIETKKDGIQPFVLNYQQRLLVAEFEKQRRAGVPMRFIMLKHRQWGGSTLTQIYMAWIQIYHKTSWHSMIIADVKNKAHHIRAMYERMAKHHPTSVTYSATGLKKLKLIPYARTDNFRILDGRNCVIGVASVENPDAPRSFTLHLLHLSEVGLWKSTANNSAEDLAQSLYGTLVDAPMTFCMKESTGKRMGTYFHKQWQQAEKGEIPDVPIFMEWFRDGQYVKPVADAAAFFKTLNDYEKFLWSKGATLEHICWYRAKLREMGDEFRMKSEYPTTPQEAFQAAGSRRFAAEIVHKARKNCRKPLMIGELYGKSMKGKAALADISFSPAANGKLQIWTMPNALGVERPNKRYTNRYCAFADIGGTTEEADYFSITVLDRLMRAFGGVPHVCAEFHGHIDPDLFAWYAARLCKWYNNAYLAVEVNSLATDKGDDDRGYSPDHSSTVLDEIKEFYDNLFYRVKPQQMQDRWDGIIGFHTNKSTKPMIIDALNAALRDEAYEERNWAACDEFDMYEIKPDGKLGATDGNHDDRVISRAGAIWLSDTMDAVREIDAEIPKVKERTIFSIPSVSS